MDNYEQKYKEALERVRNLHKDAIDMGENIRAKQCEIIFPEIKESEDEMIRKELITHCRNTRCVTEEGAEGIAKWIAWLEKQGEQKTIKVYRVENEAEEKGLWRKFDGTWQPLFDVLTDGKCKDMPMEDNPIYREGEKRWFASAPSKKALREWFSKRDLEELVSKGFTITEFEVTEYKKVSDFEYIFTRDSIINKSHLEVTDIYSEQKATDKVEPKFKVGDWIISDETHEDYRICKITNVENGNYTIESIYGYKGYNTFETFEKSYHLWTIQDAKDGDMLAAEDKDKIFLYNGNLDLRGRVCAYCGIYKTYDGFRFTKCAIGNYFTYKEPHPATKEQCDLLFKKMEEAGYRWNPDEKKLEKIESADESSAFKDKLLELFQRFRYIKEGVPTNGDIIDYVDAHIQELIDTVQNNPWSEEDKKMFVNIKACLRNANKDYSRELDWLKSIKPQPKNEWSEEDKRKIDRIYSILWQAADTHAFSTTCRLISDKECVELQDFLKALYERNTWKPSDEQIKVCREVYADLLSAKGFDVCTINSELNRLEEQLKKLREE